MKSGALEFRHHTKTTEYTVSAKTSIAATAATETCPLTHPIVSIDPDGTAVTAFNVANGEEGQMLVIITETSDDNVDVIPATSTMFASIALDTAGDCAVLYYVDDTVGWAILSLFSVASDGSPAYAVAA